MSSTQNTTAYIPTPTTGKDKPPPGWVIVLTKEGRGMQFLCTGTDISYITMRDQYDWWLRPVDLSRILEETWEEGGNWAVGPSKHPDKESYINSILNPK